MNKLGLKTGMIIETRGGKRGLVMLDNCYGEDAIVFNDESWTELEGFSNDLIWHEHESERTDHTKSLDIMKIFKPDLPTGFLKRANKFSPMNPFWERPVIIEFTMDELVEKLGYKFKIKTTS